MTLRGLIFDVDGTLADTEEAHRQAFNGAFGRHELSWAWSRSLYAQLLRVTGGKERIAHYVDSLDLEEARKDALRTRIGAIHRTKTELYARHVAAGRLPLRPGVARLLEEARTAGLKLAIATTTTPANVLALLEGTLGADAPDWFEAIIAGDMVPDKKPAPDAYLEALHRLGVPPEQCVAFEDSHNGLRSALAAGLRTVVTPSDWTRNEDFTGAARIMPSLEGDASIAPVTLASLQALLADAPALSAGTARGGG